MVNEWCKDCDLKVNVEKCNVIERKRQNEPDVSSKLENKLFRQHNLTNILG